MRNASPTTGVLAGCALLFSFSAATAQDWPQWRGPNRDNKVIGFTEPKTWPKELTQKWKVTVGEGDAGPVLVGDRVYVFTRQGSDEVIQCLNAADGMEVWKDKYSTVSVTGGARGHPGPRSTPAVAEGKVCTLGVGGVLSCLDAATGKVVWRKDTKAWPMFYAASSPIIVDGKCIAFLGGAPGGGRGGKGDLSAYDLNSGEMKWQWTRENPAYGSPVLLTVDGSKQLVALAQQSLVAVGVDDGKQLWLAPFSSRYNSCTPVVAGDTVICSAPSGGGGFGGGGGGGRAGTVAFKIEKKDDGFTAREVWRKDQAAGIYNTPTLKDGVLYGLLAGPGRGATNLFCMNAETGAMLWTDSTRRGECGEVLDAGSVLLALTSDSNLLVFKPSKKGYEEVAKYKVSDSPTWAAPIIAGNRVFAKGKDTLTLWTIE